MQNYEKILKNCQECLEKYKISQDPNAARRATFLKELREKCKENTSEMRGDSLYKLEDLSVSKQYVPKLEEYDYWKDIVPPLWDESLNKNYVESLVNDFFTQKSFCSDESSEKSIIVHEEKVEPKTNYQKKDQASLVRDSDFPDELKAKWKPVKAVQTITPPKVMPMKKKISPQTQKNKPKTKIIAPLVKPPYQIKKSTTKDIPLSSQQIPVQSNRKPPRMQYLRFVGRSRSPGFDFSAEHPHFMLDEAADSTSFPCRLDKPSENIFEINEKSNTKSKDPPVDSEESSTMKNEQLSATATVASIDKTWHEVLTERLIEGRDRRVLKFNWKDDGDVQRERLPTPKDCDGEERQYSGRDIIYDSAGVVRWNEKLSPNKLSVQKLPVLCIRGNCKLQKVVQISIGGNDEEEPRIEKDENVGYIQCKYQTFKEKTKTEISTGGEMEKDAIITKEDEEVNNVTETAKSNSPVKTEIGKGVNKYFAPFIRTESSSTKCSPYTNTETSENVETSNGITATEADQSNSNTNDSDISTQIDDEKIKKINSVKTSSLSSTNSQTSNEIRSNTLRESHSTEPSSSESVSQFLDKSNLQIPVKYPKDVQDILKDVLCFSEAEEDDRPDHKQVEQKQTVTVGTDCTDLVRGVEMGVQIEDNPGNYSKQLSGLKEQLLKKSDKPAVVQLEADSNSDRQSTGFVDKIVEKICKDETEGLRSFKSRALRFSPRKDARTPPTLRHLKQTYSTESTTPKSSTIIESSKASKIPPVIANSPVELHMETIPIEIGKDNTIERVDDGGNNYTDNHRAIKGDEAEERCHQSDEYPSPLCLESHSNLLGRNCYCVYHRQKDAVELSCEEILNPLQVLYDTNFRLSNISLQSNYAKSLTQQSRQSTYKEFQKRVLEQNPRFLKTITKIYDAAPNVTAKPSNRMDPEVQRAVKKFLKSLMEPKSSLHRRYSTMSRPKEYSCGADNVSTLAVAVPSFNRPTSKGWTPTCASSVSSSSSKRHSFSGIWKSNDTSMSDTESSELQRILDAPLWNDRSIKTTTFSSYQRVEDNLDSLTGSSTSSIRSPPAKSFRPPSTTKKSAESISEGEVLSLGEVRDFESCS